MKRKITRFRAYNPYSSKSNDDAVQHDTPVALQHDAQGVLIDALKAQIDLLKDQVAREREQTDHWRRQATMLLTHQQKPEPAQPVTRSMLWEKLFGNRR